MDGPSYLSETAAVSSESETGNWMQFVGGFVAKTESPVSGVRWRRCSRSRCGSSMFLTS